MSDEPNVKVEDDDTEEEEGDRKAGAEPPEAEVDECTAVGAITEEKARVGEAGAEEGEREEDGEPVGGQPKISDYGKTRRKGRKYRQKQQQEEDKNTSVTAKGKPTQKTKTREEKARVREGEGEGGRRRTRRSGAKKYQTKGSKRRKEAKTERQTNKHNRRTAKRG